MMVRTPENRTPQPADEVAVSIIIVSFNTADVLQQCLHAVREAAARLTVEVIVIDNASWDGSADMVESRFPEVKLIRNASNMGFAKACNQGIRMSSGAYILLLNSDVQLLPDTLEKMVRFMGERDEAGAAACQLQNSDGSVQPSVRDFPSLKGELFGALFLDRLFPSSHLFGSYRKKNLRGDGVAPVDQVSGAFLLVRREVLRQVGPLDERFFIYYEDVDWCLRIRQAGWTILYVPECAAIHFGGRSADQFRAFPYVEGMRSKILYFRKHHGPFVTLLVQLVAVIEGITRLLVWRAGRGLGPARSSAGKGWDPATVVRIISVAWFPRLTRLYVPEPAHG